jgi:hypothetical protein
MVQVLQKGLMAVRNQGNALVEPTTQAAVIAFQACAAPESLDTLTEVVEIFGSDGAHEAVLTSAVSAVFSSGLTLLHVRPGLGFCLRVGTMIADFAHLLYPCLAIFQPIVPCSTILLDHKHDSLLTHVLKEPAGLLGTANGQDVRNFRLQEF